MADIVTSVVEIKGDESLIKKLIEATKLKEDATLEENEFDFQGIKPMPEELHDIASPNDVVETQEEADEINKKHAETMKSDIERGMSKIKAITKEREAELIEKYGMTTRNGIFRPRPVTNWHTWANEHWGTKWGAFQVKFIQHTEGVLVIQFDTAWGYPQAIFEELERQGYTVNGVCYGEGGGPIVYIGEGDDLFEVHTEHTVEYVG